MKKFLMYCLVLVVMLFVGFTTYYFVANKENIILAFDQTQTLKLNKGETFYFTDIITHTEPYKSTKINVSIADTKVLTYDETEKKFTATDAGNTVLTIKPTNTRFGPYNINVRVGNGLSTEYPIFISDAAELASIDATNSAWNSELYYELIADIKLVDYPNWTPIALTNEYNKTFNGAGYTIYNLTLDETNTFSNAGLFAKIGKNGIVKNIRFVEADIQGQHTNVGVVAGLNKGTVCLIDVSNSNISNTASDGATGGIVGTNDYTSSENSIQAATIGMCGVQTTTITAKNYVGGIVGKNNAGTIENCYAYLTSFTSNSTSTWFGGIAGQNSLARINNTTTTSTIKYTHASCTTIDSTGVISGITANTNDTGSGYKNSYTRNYYTLATENFVGTRKATDYVVQNIEKKDVADLSKQSMYIDWDFKNIWNLSNNTYATLNYSYAYTTSKTITDIDDETDIIIDPIVPGDEPGEVITTEDELYAMVCEMRANPNSGKIYVVNSYTSNTVQMTSYPWNQEPWEPIGTPSNPFTCKFMIKSGLDLTFNNLSITNKTYSGFFGYVGNGATISNLKISNLTITTNSSSTNQSFGYAGGIAGYVNTNAVISSCQVSNVKITGYDKIGGIAGTNHGTIQNSKVFKGESSILKANNLTANVGGIAGANNGTIFSCEVNSVDLTFAQSANGNIGGIAGTNDGNISAVTTTSNIYTSSSDLIQAGGIAGVNNKVITNATAKNTTITLTETSNNAYAGGITASNATTGTISLSKVISQFTTSHFAGGLASENFGTIRQSMAGNEALGIGTVKGAFVGGLVVNNRPNALVKDCGVYENLQGTDTFGNVCGFAFSLKVDSVIENCFSSANITGKGWLRCDTDTAYKNWASGILQNLPWSERMGTIINSVIDNITNSYVQGYGVVVDWFPGANPSRYDTIVSTSIAKGEDNFDTFIKKDFSSSTWTFANGRYPTPTI